MKKNLDLSPLDNYSLKGVTASIILDTRRAKKNGDYPVKYRIRYNKKQDYYFFKDLSKEIYDKLHRASRTKDLIRTKKLITDRFKEYTDLIEDIEPFDLKELARRIKGGTEDSILDAFKNKIDALNNKGKIGTAVWYSCTLSSIKKYTNRGLKFSDITTEWLKNYETYLLKEVIVKGKNKTKKKTTVSMYMRALRSIINQGKADGIISQAQYPFLQKKNGKYSIPKGSGRKIALSEAQLLEVFDHPISPNDEKWRDLWVFSFYCNGVNINDILRFKYKDIVGDIIEWERQKTKDTSDDDKKIRAYVNDEMKRIIVQWGNPDHKPDNNIFDYLKSGMSPIQERMVIQNVTHTINKKMKKIGRALKFGDITTYWSRHSWASISRRKGTSVFVISKGLGHGSLKITDDYLASISIDELKENADLLPRRKI